MRRLSEFIQLTLTPEDKRALAALSERTKVPQAVLARTALQEFIARAEREGLAIGIPASGGPEHVSVVLARALDGIKGGG